MNDFLTLIMAAGEGTRMKSDMPKVLQKINGRPLIDWVIRSCGETRPVVIVGHKKEQVKNHLLDRADFVVQERQKGTGHAVMMAKDMLKAHKGGYAVILAGDMPLLKKETIDRLKETARKGYDAVMLTATVSDPHGYGRVLHGDKGDVIGIVEEKDATNEQRKIQEINASVYCMKIDRLLSCLERLTCDNAAEEYYLTDCIQMMAENGKVTAIEAELEQCLGVNNKVQLAQAAGILRRRINERLMLDGAVLIDPETSYIDDTVKIGRDAVIYPNNILSGETEIGEACVIYSGSRLSNAKIGKGTTVQSSVIVDATVGENTTVGPFAYLRPDSRIGSGCRIGDFVEIKNSAIGDTSKVSHLTYVGDSDVGAGVNIGCGVVFVNYDGVKKHRSKVGDHCFIGCNTNLVSPVQVGDGAYIAAGATVTEDVPSDALCIARARQVNKEHWVTKWKEERKKDE